MADLASPDPAQPPYRACTLPSAPASGLTATLASASRLNPLSPESAQLRQELGEVGTIEVGG